MPPPNEWLQLTGGLRKRRLRRRVGCIHPQLNSSVRRTTHFIQVKAIAAAIVLTACASAGTTATSVTPLPCPPGGLAADATPPGLVPARPDSLFTPPLPVPASLRGAKSEIRVVVDAQGRPFADSITVCGVSDSGYARRMAERVARIPFRPAQLDGRAVSAATRLYYGF